MLLIVTKWRSIVISLLLSLSALLGAGIGAHQDLMAAAPNAVTLSSEISLPTSETEAPNSGRTHVAESGLATQAAYTTTVVISPTAISHELFGFGVHMFDNDHSDPTQFENALETLGLRYIRVPFGPNWDHANIPVPPPPCNDGADPSPMYDFVKQYFNADFSDRLIHAQEISAIAEARNIEIIFLNWQAHGSWLTDPTDYRELKEEYVDDYACFVAQVVKFLTDEGVKLKYLEPTNEPAGTHNTKIPPARYNVFVKYLRTYLDTEGLSEIQILGPGLAYLNHDDMCRIYLEALDDDGVKAISVWAVHAWDPEFPPNQPEADILRMKWEECRKAIEMREGSGPSKPIFVTEFGCVNDKGNPVCAVENALTLLDCGANAVIYWHLREQEWDPPQAAHALLTQSYEEKPAYNALASFLPAVTSDGVSVLETKVEGRTTAASFRTAEAWSETEVVAVLVNRHPEPEHVVIDKSNMIGNMAVQIVYDGETDHIGGSELLACQGERCQLVLSPNTVTTLIFELWKLYLPSILVSMPIEDTIEER